MLFNSIEFLFFFPIVTLLFFILPHKLRWFLLLVASCGFYMAFIPAYILILFLTIVVDYIAGIAIEKAGTSKKRIFLILSLITNIGILAVFKYYNFFVSNYNSLFAGGLSFLKMALPIGLSFHTFQAMSYTIEVYRGNQKAEKHFGIYALYVMFYPQLVAGPIERPQNILHQFHERKKFLAENATIGLRLVLLGFFRKVVIGDTLGVYVDSVYANIPDTSTFSILIALVFYAFQIYCDFSGYSLIAIGTARAMGFNLMKNFNAPYFSRSIGEFWTRWHISLSTWFRDYLYIPLGGNQVSLTKWIRNISLVFTLSGLWHGANWTFIIWGILHATAMIYERTTSSLRASVSRSLPGALWKILTLSFTFGFICFSWIFFRSPTMSIALNVVNRITHILSDGSFSSFISILHQLYNVKYEILLILGLLLMEKLNLKYDFWTTLAQKRYLRYLCYYMLILMVAYSWMNHDASTSFIYFQF